LEIPADFQTFHERELVERPDAALAVGFFEGWCRAHPGSVPLSFDRCVGYRVPLFPGGADDLANLEMTDFDVYWSLSARLLATTRDAPPGASIYGFEIDGSR
jgi:hypothetical protein